MSDLQKEFVKARLAKLSTPEQLEEQNGLHSASSDSDVTPTEEHPDPFREPSIGHSKPSQYSWEDFFESKLSLHVNDGRSITGYYTRPKFPDGPLFIFQHGAGSSALSFASAARCIAEVSDGEVGVLTLDLRGHGSSASAVDDRPNWHMDSLKDDFVEAIRAFQVDQGFEELPQNVLVGHSLGGAILTNVASEKRIPNVLGLAVLDIVEGYAVDAFRHMKTYFAKRPSSFPSVNTAIKWHIETKSLRNMESAKVSVPGLLVPERREDGSLAYQWRTDLPSTEPYWDGWFKGLSERFLKVPVGKLLLLAGTDRLDKPLMIGQMQGKYQLAVFPESGHFVHEDFPQKTADLLYTFWQRNQKIDIGQIRKAADL